MDNNNEIFDGDLSLKLDETRRDIKGLLEKKYKNLLELETCTKNMLSCLQKNDTWSVNSELDMREGVIEELRQIDDAYYNLIESQFVKGHEKEIFNDSLQRLRELNKNLVYSIMVVDKEFNQKFCKDKSVY